MCKNIYKDKSAYNYINMTTKKIDELTLDEIKEQLALYQRLYYKVRKETDPEYIQKRREKDRHRKSQKKELQKATQETTDKKWDYNRKYFGNNYMILQAS